MKNRTDRLIWKLAEMRVYFLNCEGNAAPGSIAQDRFTGYCAALDNAIAELSQKEARWLKISPAGIYECSACGQHVMTSDIEAYQFCHGCGRRVEQDAAD